MNMNVTRQQFVTWAAVSLIGLCVLAASALAEELRIITYQGTVPESQVETFKQLIKEKYQVELTVTLSWLSDPGDSLTPLKNGQIDILSCPHNIPKDANFKYITGKLTLPLDLNNIPNYANLIPALQSPEYISEDGQVYGVAYAYGPYGLVYNTNLVSAAPTSWKVLWEPQYAGKYAISADFYELNVLTTALAQGVPKDKLGQFESVSSPAFLEQLTALSKNAKNKWVGIDTADSLQGLSLGAAFGFALNELATRGEVWQFASPQEGTTVGVGNWMLSHTLRDKPQLKQIAEEWINFTIGPEYQYEVIVKTISNFPVSLAIKDRLTTEEVARFHLDNPNYFKDNMILWPMLDKRTRTGFELLWQKATR